MILLTVFKKYMDIGQLTVHAYTVNPGLFTWKNLIKMVYLHCI